jgi:hypothetical protein
MKIFNIATVLFLVIGVIKSTRASDQQSIFPQSLLTEFLNWETVLPNGGAYKSEGHGGIFVRVHFNDKAVSGYTGETPLPLAEGSIVAKARIDTLETPSEKASRVYFMKKMDPAYDPQNGNWAYGFADYKNGQYVFNQQMGRVGLCIKCHQQYSNLDYLKTIEIYRQSHP